MDIISAMPSFFEVINFMAPICIPVIIGVILGWLWKPKVVKESLVDFDLISVFDLLRSQLSSFICDDSNAANTCVAADCPTSGAPVEAKENSVTVNEDDFRHLYKLVEEKDDGPVWIKMMERSTPTTYFHGYIREPETGPAQYRTITVYENVSAEFLRDFFWDDEFRVTWDYMFVHCSTLEACQDTGTMLVHWIRKFPLFCSDREYAIGRRIWDYDGAYYCVTKSVPCPSLPRRTKPRRVDLLYSSWCIRPAESKKEPGKMTACEVILFHHEDMGIPKELAKFGIRQGMWPTAKKIEPAWLSYRKHRESGAPLSPSALMAQINTKVTPDLLPSLETTSTTPTAATSNINDDNNNVDTIEAEYLGSTEKSLQKRATKLLVVGGAMVLACSLDRGFLTKAVILGVARKIAMT